MTEHLSPLWFLLWPASWAVFLLLWRRGRRKEYRRPPARYSVAELNRLTLAAWYEAHPLCWPSEKVHVESESNHVPATERA